MPDDGYAAYPNFVIETSTSTLSVLVKGKYANFSGDDDEAQEPCSSEAGVAS